MNGLNLLPWREKLREKNKKQFFLSMGGGVAVALVIITLVHMMIARQVGIQQSIDKYLNEETAVLDKKIAVIKDLKVKKQDLLQRLDLIHSLQTSRPLTVKLFDELVRITPTGVYNISLKREGSLITIKGKGESNMRISQLMRQVEASKYLGNPVLSEIKTDDSDISYSRDFTLQFTVKGMEKEKKNNEEKVKKVS